MFKGRAELVDPEKGTIAATFAETCEGDGSATGKVVLKHPIELTGTERLELYGDVKDQALISVSAKYPTGNKIHEFSGKLSLGCVPDQGKISLVKTPGGKLGTLLEVIGNGRVSQEP
ncbi:MAG: hypothetical protein JO305_08670 [Alphaproteobacteria bacterium]|nr:hypothetical protein [Alphaproteobacteria bacterium]